MIIIGNKSNNREWNLKSLFSLYSRDNRTPLIWKPGPEVSLFHSVCLDGGVGGGWVRDRRAGGINDRDTSIQTLTARPVSCFWLQAADSRLFVIRAEDAGAGVGLLVPPLPFTHHRRSHIISVRRQRPAAVRWGECFLLLLLLLLLSPDILMLLHNTGAF